MQLTGPSSRQYWLLPLKCICNTIAGCPDKPTLEAASNSSQELGCLHGTLTLHAHCMQATVGDLKEQLVSKAAVPKERQRLIWRGRVLQDGQLLDEAGELALLAPVPCLTSARNLHI